MEHKYESKTILAMVCSNFNCDTWYRVGTHFFEVCPTCKVPMKKMEKEILFKSDKIKS